MKTSHSMNSDDIYKKIIFLLKEEIAKTTQTSIEKIPDELAFSSLGIDSMKMMLLIGEIEGKLQPFIECELTYNEVFMYPTIAEMAKYITEKINDRG